MDDRPPEGWDRDQLPPGARRRGPGRTRQTVGLILLFILLGIFALVMARRIQTRKALIAEAEKEISDDSAAVATMNARHRRPHTQRMKSAEIDKAMDAINGANDAARAACDAWDRAHATLPHGKLTPDMARTALAGRSSFSVALREADTKITLVGNLAEEVRSASRAPGIEAYNLSRVYSAIITLRDKLNTVSQGMWEMDRLTDEYLQAMVDREWGDAEAAVNALNGVNERTATARQAATAAGDALADASKSVFDVTPVK